MLTHLSVGVAIVLFPCLCLAQQDVVTCSGKIQSSFKINYSRININLYTKSGSLIESSDCAPNSGYFVVPIFDKGDYVIKVAPPTGWGFEPSEVIVSFDGTNDPCSPENDIKFEFVGFTVSGQVNNVGHSNGPRGVTVNIKGPKIFEETKTLDDGIFNMPNILPGEYTITGSHAVWSVSKNPVAVTVSEDVVRIPINSIVVEGYDVKGYIRSKGDPVAGVWFLLYALPNGGKVKVACKSFENIPTVADDGVPPSCATASSKEGVFVFPSLPTGDYRIVPYYKSSDESTYQVSPSETRFSVVNDSVIIEPNFEVQGFSVHGIVLQSKDGKALDGASVMVNGDVSAKTDKNGRYELLNVTAGIYTIQVTAPEVEFDAVDMSFTPSSPTLQTIYPTKYSVCGEVRISFQPLGKRFKTSSCSIEVKPETDFTKPLISSTIIDEKGQFCMMLAPGEHSVKIIVKTEDSERGLAFINPVLSVTVDRSPIKYSQLTFRQFTNDMKVQVKCKAVCKGIKISIERVADGYKDKLSVTKTAEVSFNKILPGSYKVSITSDHQKLCWTGGDEQLVTVPSTEEMSPVVFTQSGYLMEIKSNKDTDVKMIVNEDEKSTEILKVSKGMNSFCVEEFGQYSLMPESCYTFDGDMYVFMTAMPFLVEMKAVSHKVIGTVIAPNPVKIEVSFSGLKKPRKNKLLDSTFVSEEPTDSDDNTYTYSFDARPGTIVHLTPVTDSLLCYPPHLNFTVEDTCPETVDKPFECDNAEFISGCVDPPLEGVAVTVTLTTDEEQINVFTDKKGCYKAGPVSAGTSYTVDLALDRYVFSHVSEDDPNNFKAIKVSRVTIKVTDTADSPMTDVLVSMSGEAFRSTDVVTEDGTFTYNDLHPGEFYVKPILREFEFSPPSQVIELAQGEDVSATFIGRKVAFSVSGKVMSLNRTPLQGVMVQVFGHGEKCESFKETSLSNEEGTYRFRGIMPSCSYYVSVVTESDDSLVEASLPKRRFLQIADDVSGEDFVTVLKPTQFTVTGNVVTTTPEYLQTLKIVVYSDKFLDSIIYSTTPDSMGFFSITLKPTPSSMNQMYYVQAETSLSGHYYTIETNSTSFSTSDSNSHITLSFFAQPAPTTTESFRGSFIGILISVAGVFIFFNMDKVFSQFQAANVLKRLSLGRKAKRR